MARGARSRRGADKKGGSVYPSDQNNKNEKSAGVARPPVSRSLCLYSSNSSSTEVYTKKFVTLRCSMSSALRHWRPKQNARWNDSGGRMYRARSAPENRPLSPSRAENNRWLRYAYTRTEPPEPSIPYDAPHASIPPPFTMRRSLNYMSTMRGLQPSSHATPPLQ